MRENKVKKDNTQVQLLLRIVFIHFKWGACSRYVTGSQLSISTRRQFCCLHKQSKLWNLWKVTVFSWRCFSSSLFKPLKGNVWICIILWQPNVTILFILPNYFPAPSCYVLYFWCNSAPMETLSFFVCLAFVQTAPDDIGCVFGFFLYSLPGLTGFQQKLTGDFRAVTAQVSDPARLRHATWDEPFFSCLES